MKLPKHKCGLTIQHNIHNSNYQTAKEYIEGKEEANNEPGWQSQEHRQRAIDTNEIWEMQWYPDTPVGHYSAAAPTLEELLSFVNSEEWK